jgi:hypothetical protein
VVAQADRGSHPGVAHGFRGIVSTHPHEPAPAGIVIRFPEASTVYVHGPSSNDTINPDVAGRITQMISSLEPIKKLKALHMLHQGILCTPADMILIFDIISTVLPGLKHLFWEWKVPATADTSAALQHLLAPALQVLELVLHLAMIINSASDVPSVGFQLQLPAGLKTIELLGDAGFNGLDELIATAAEAPTNCYILALAGLCSSPGIEKVVVSRAVITDTDAISDLHHLQTLCINDSVAVERILGTTNWRFFPSLLPPDLTLLTGKDHLHTVLQTSSVLGAVNAVQVMGSFSLKYRAQAPAFLAQHQPPATAHRAGLALLPALKSFSCQGALPELGQALAGHSTLVSVTIEAQGSWQHGDLLQHLSSCSKLQFIFIFYSSGMTSAELCRGLIALVTGSSRSSLRTMRVEAPSSEGMDFESVLTLLSSTVNGSTYSFFGALLPLQPDARQAVNRLAELYGIPYPAEEDDELGCVLLRQRASQGHSFPSKRSI